ncbi:T9SS type B sorting domain-containing protein [Spirosoma flavum]|uniref:Gliding motility-associated C-terminal domain-containing protein n=1 Tax=Spirosoma flavum TaxID=2048557 RepID=A0ABW6AHB3_9BACT
MVIRIFIGLLLLLSISSTTISKAQNVAGLWLGVTYPSKPTQDVFNYTMTLTQTGNALAGTAQTANPDVPFGGLAYISGQVNSSTVTFNESDKNGNTTVKDICFWRGTMTYNPVDESLIGTYESITNGTTCTDASGGKVELYRIVLKSGATYCAGKPINLVVTGKNVRWYSSAAKTSRLAIGNTYSPKITQTTTFYITQTLYKNESPAVPITIEVTSPTFKATSTNTGCDKANGSIEIAASDTTGWQYKLNGGAFQKSPLFTSLSPGSYTVVAKDAAGCQAEQPVTITTDAAPTISSLQSTPPMCATANGEVTVIAAGGKAPLTYSIDYGVSFQSSPIFGRLPGGAYTLRVRDANGCEVNKVISLPSFKPMEIISATTVPTTCGQSNGQITMTVAGGQNPVRYSLDNRQFQANTLFTGLQAGVYTLLAKDSTGCTISQSVSIAASSGPQAANIQTIASSCGEENGAIVIPTSAVATNVDFSIDGQSFQRSSNFSGLKAGTYTLTLKDDKNCVTTQSVSIPLDCADRIHLPTAFSPNQDMRNDALTVHFAFPSIKVVTFIVYDRWGAVLYNRANFAISSGEPLWDGQINGQSVPAGMYAYRLDCQFPDGTQLTYRQSVALLY